MKSRDLEAINRLLSDHVAAINAGNVGANLRGFTEDIVYLPPDEPLMRGKEALEALIRAGVESFAARIEMVPEETTIAGEWAFQWALSKARFRRMRAVTVCRWTGNGCTYITVKRTEHGRSPETSTIATYRQPQPLQVGQNYEARDNRSKAMKATARRSTALIALALVVGIGCARDQSASAGEESGPSSQEAPELAVEGFILRTGDGEFLQNGIVVKASPATGTEGSILVEQTFPKGGTTTLHLHEQGDELFYVVAGRGTATLDGLTDEIGPGDVIFVPRYAVHRIENLTHDEPLQVVFFMDTPELVEEFRAIHERVASDPDQPITPEERAAISERIGGGRAVQLPQ